MEIQRRRQLQTREDRRDRGGVPVMINGSPASPVPLVDPSGCGVKARLAPAGTPSISTRVMVSEPSASVSATLTEPQSRCPLRQNPSR